MEKRFFITKENLDRSIITLWGEEHNHLSKVLRLSVGDKVECFENGGKLIECTIASITKNATTLNVLGAELCNSNPRTNVTLYQALPKGEKLELIIQKTSELGISAIKTFTSNFTIAKPNDNKLERMKKIAISAAKQCGRTAIIDLSPTITFNKMLDELKDYDTVIFANETENKTSLKDIVKKSKNIALVVGSEGGFAKSEIDALINSGAVSVSLGNRILRAETAAIALSTCVLYELGELSL